MLSSDIPVVFEEAAGNNIGGLEHRREKWGKYAKAFLKFSEKMAVKYADAVIADNKGIQDYVREEYGKEAELIAYGGDHVLCDIADVEEQILEKYGLKNISYSFSLCRIEPENNVHVILEAFKASLVKNCFSLETGIGVRMENLCWISMPGTGISIYYLLYMM